MSNNDLKEWKALETHRQDVGDIHIRDLFDDEPSRFDNFHLSLNGLVFDFSKHRVNHSTIEKLCALAKACDLPAWQRRMADGEAINETENRASLHMALRGSVDETLEVDGENVTAFVSDTLSRIQSLSEEIRGSEITDVINIGIGGSDLGPQIVCDALSASADGPNIHFISNIDGNTLESLFHGLNPKNTLVVIVSKTFSTLETIINARSVKEWLLNSIDAYDLPKHLIAVSTNEYAAQDFGVAADRILPLRNWIGGRFSLWSSVGLSIAIANGFKIFQDLLNGAKIVDRHFLDAPLERNIPVLMGMLGIWYRNFWNYPTHAVLPYAQALSHFPQYVQQLDMESNGKSVDRNGQSLSYASGPVIFGEVGTNAQHAFMQHLHQSHEITPVDFIIVKTPNHHFEDHHRQMLANALAQSKALMAGRASDDTHRDFSGNRPSSTILLDQLDAKHMGMLLALYEHKIFVQGVIWGINSFDQFGVELGKSIAQDIDKALSDNTAFDGFDASTAGLLKLLK